MGPSIPKSNESKQRSDILHNPQTSSGVIIDPYMDYYIKEKAAKAAPFYSLEGPSPFRLFLVIVGIIHMNGSW